VESVAALSTQRQDTINHSARMSRQDGLQFQKNNEVFIMNEKQAKRIRKLAMSKAQSQNETSTNGVKFRKLIDGEQYSKHFDKTINIIKGHFIQRKLDPFSLKKISKSIKTLFKQTPKDDRPKLLVSLEQDMSIVGV
jgi:hypothetical protein